MHQSRSSRLTHVVKTQQHKFIHCLYFIILFSVCMRARRQVFSVPVLIFSSGEGRKIHPFTGHAYYRTIWTCVPGAHNRSIVCRTKKTLSFEIFTIWIIVHANAKHVVLICNGDLHKWRMPIWIIKLFADGRARREKSGGGRLTKGKVYFPPLIMTCCNVILWWDDHSTISISFGLVFMFLRLLLEFGDRCAHVLSLGNISGRHRLSIGCNVADYSTKNYSLIYSNGWKME